MRLLLALLAYIEGFVAATAAVAQPSPPALAAVWAQEDRYWASREAGDDANYQKLFHGRFTGWPCGSETTARRPSLVTPPPRGAKLSVVLDDKASTGGPDYVVVYYRATMRTEGADRTAEVKTRNFTHTWVQSQGGWKIIGGMCRDAPSTLK